MGRPPAPVVKYVEESTTAGKKQYKCKFCGKTSGAQTLQATPWAEHIALLCPKAPDGVKAEVAAGCKSDKIARGFTPAAPPPRAGGGIEEPAAKRARASVAEGIADHCTPTRAAIINAAITRFIVGCGLPFTIVSSVFFLAMISALNAAYVKQLPKVTTFRTRLLPELYEDTVKKVRGMWAARGQPKLTFGFDGFKGEDGTHVVNCTESALGNVAFVNCIRLRERHEDAKTVADIIYAELKKGADAAGKSIEETYAAVVGDNTEHNIATFKLLEVQLPTLFYMGCIAHKLDLLNEDMAKIKELLTIVRACRDMVVFVKGRRTVQEAFRRIIGPNGVTLKTFPETRFAYAALTVDRVNGNYQNLLTLITEPEWTANTTQGMDQRAIIKFESLINGFQLGQATALVAGVLRPLSAATHYVEGTQMRASFIPRLLTALRQDLVGFCQSDRAKTLFAPATLKEIMTKYDARLVASGRLRAALHSPTDTVAEMLDPYTRPSALGRRATWDEDACEVLSKYYKGDDFHEAKTELKNILVGMGRWGAICLEKQKRVAPEDGVIFGSHVEHEIAICKAIEDAEHPLLDWELHGQGQFPRLWPVAQKLLSASVQSANVERACSAHKIIHTKARNRLHEATVQKLLYCYCNLRLLEKCDDLGDFLTSCLENCVDDDEPPLAAGPAPAEPDD